MRCLVFARLYIFWPLCKSILILENTSQTDLVSLATFTLPLTSQLSLFHSARGCTSDKHTSLENQSPNTILVCVSSQLTPSSFILVSAQAPSSPRNPSGSSPCHVSNANHRWRASFAALSTISKSGACSKRTCRKAINTMLKNPDI